MSRSSLIARAILIRRLRKRLKRKAREVSIRPIFMNRFYQSENILVRELANDQVYHHRYFRMSKENFDYILSLVKDQLTTKRTHSRPISAVEKLALTLRYLATGNSQISMSFNFRISPSSVSKIVFETLQVLIRTLGPIYLPEPTTNSWTKNETGFTKLWNFPNCCGAIDGKHVRIKSPRYSGSRNYNYKNFFSIVLLAITDPYYKFTAVDIGASGSISDSGVFDRSGIQEKLEKGSFQLLPPKKVGDHILPQVIVGDDAFPLKSNLMKPYPGKFLEKKNRIFNYRLSRARLVVENSFGILASRWRILHTPIATDIEVTKRIVHAAVILHNFCLVKKDSTITGDTVKDSGDIEPGSWREQINDEPILSQVTRQGTNNFTIDAGNVRHKFKEYFNSEIGSVKWQLDRVNKL